MADWLLNPDGTVSDVEAPLAEWDPVAPIYVVNTESEWARIDAAVKSAKLAARLWAEGRPATLTAFELLEASMDKHREENARGTSTFLRPLPPREQRERILPTK